MLAKAIQSQTRNLFSATRVTCFSTWGHVEPGPPDPILGLNEAYKKETNPKKILLGMGTYKDDNNKPYVLSCIRKAERIIIDKQMDHEYAGIQGIDSYIDKCIKLAWGEDTELVKNGQVAGA